MKNQSIKIYQSEKNPFLNALQVKYSYALTCHKSQGGQWENIFIEKPFMPDGINRDYLRWLYTAITRATKKLFLIGFQKKILYKEINIMKQRLSRIILFHLLKWRLIGDFPKLPKYIVAVVPHTSWVDFF